MANEQTDQWNRITSPQISPSIYRNLVYMKLTFQVTKLLNI